MKHVLLLIYLLVAHAGMAYAISLFWGWNIEPWINVSINFPQSIAFWILFASMTPSGFVSHIVEISKKVGVDENEMMKTLVIRSAFRPLFLILWGLAISAVQ